MKKIGEINCGCENDCKKRIRLYWYKKNIVAKDPHGNEGIVTQHYSRRTKKQAIEDLIAMYASEVWGLDLAE